MRINEGSVVDGTIMLRAAYAALNRGDVAAFVEMFDPQIERVEPLEFAGGGTFRGIAELTEHFTKARGTWAEGSCEPERFMSAGDRIIAFVQVRVRLKHETQWREGRTVDVYTFRYGKAEECRTVLYEWQALD